MKLNYVNYEVDEFMGSDLFNMVVGEFDEGFNDYVGHCNWVGEEWDAQRELTQEEKSKWYEEPKELEF